jgi:hypothetical protein
MRPSGGIGKKMSVFLIHGFAVMGNGAPTQTFDGVRAIAPASLALSDQRRHGNRNITRRA